MSLTTKWAPYFDGRVRMRGRAYCNQGRVEPQQPKDGERFRASVQGQADRPYYVVFKGENELDEVSCTCVRFAEGHYCRHIWAALLYMQQLDEPAGGSSGSPFEPRLPRARRRTGQRKTNQCIEPAWMTRLSLLRTSGYQLERMQPPLKADLRELWYLVDAELCINHDSLVIDLHQRLPAAGGSRALRRFKINPRTASRLPEEVDRELCAALLGAVPVSPHESPEEIVSPVRSSSTFRIPASARLGLLRRMIETGRVLVRDEINGDHSLRWDSQAESESPWKVWLVGSQSEDAALELNLQLRRGAETMGIDEPSLMLGGRGGLLVQQSAVAPFDDGGAFRWVLQFRDQMRQGGRAEPLLVGADDVQRFLDRLYRLPNLPEIELPEGVGPAQQQHEPRPHLELVRASGGVRKNLSARLWFAYDRHRVKPGQAGRYLMADEPSQEGGLAMVIGRDQQREQHHYQTLIRMGLQPSSSGEPDRLLLPIKQMLPVMDHLIAHGWSILVDRREVRPSAAPTISVASGVDWFELRGQVTYQTSQGPQHVELPEVLAAARSGHHTLRLDDGSEGLLPGQWLEQNGVLAAIGKVEGDHLRFQLSQAVLIDALLAEHANVQVDQRFASAREKLRHFTGIESQLPLSSFRGTLRPYQCDGLGWLTFWQWFGGGGILADDMGLGKTVQVLAQLDRHYHGGSTDQTDSIASPPQALNPSLVVVPRSVVFNWIDEAARFTPKLRVQAYTGADRHARRDDFGDHHLIITSYGLMRRDINELRHHEFDYVVLDEAQTIKNPASQSAKAARLLRARYRLALTGTPVENHLGDLWSIFEFLNPGMLGASSRFTDLVRGGVRNGFAADGDGGNRSGHLLSAASSIATALRPFILRRTKQQVLGELPPKTEQTIICQMEPAQRGIYDELRQYYRRVLMSEVTDSGGQSFPRSALKGAGRPMMVLEALLRLRQAACHPALIDAGRAGEPSAKMDVLLDRLGDLIEENHKALVFSQFTSMLALVRQRLDERSIRYSYLDGQTRHRKRVVDRFQTDPKCPVFLISLKAGGVGLNLTAAEYVFILDPWWNPAVEAQAIDRTHRIGQNRHVFAYRLICQDTVEQRILELQDKKRKLADAIIDGQPNLLENLTKADLERLLS